MNYKWINVFMIGADPITVRDGEITYTDDGFIDIEAERTIWHINVDQVRYVKFSKGDAE